MIERIKLISNVGNYLQTKSGQIEFKPVNIIYGENRNGKSTLCDIFYSLALNDPKIVTDRKSITLDQESNEIQQEINIKFSGRKDAIKFKNGEWEETTPDCSKLYIFDHGFIHRNVMTGINYTRENSTNMSGFILGENAKYFEELELKNQKIRENKKSLSSLQSEIILHNIGDFDDFIKSPLPTLNIEQIRESIETTRKKQLQLNYQINNIKQVKSRPILKYIPKLPIISHFFRDVNELLSSSIDNVHEKSKSIIENHKYKIINPDSFNNWIAYGLQHLKEDCPFCGQILDHNSLILLESYKQAFNTEYERFLNKVKDKISYLSRTGLPKLNEIKLINTYNENILIINLYAEDEIKNQIDICLKEQLLKDFNNFKKCGLDFSISLNNIETMFQTALELKAISPHKPIQNINFSIIEELYFKLIESIETLNLCFSAINILIEDFKSTQSIEILQKNESNELSSINKLEVALKRHSLNDLCNNYINLKNKIKLDETKLKIEKKSLSDKQEIFLDKYFHEINTLFKNIGSKEFNISRSINNIGARTVYELSVSFKGSLIDRNKFHCLFSESDRRALAFCIFIAKIHQLPKEERSKAIVVLDDPVTSFDNERTMSMLRLLYKLQPSIKQLIITTHYKGMATAVLNKFPDAQPIKITQNKDGSQLQKATIEELTATAHDETYMEILSFIQRDTIDNKINKLRPFLENEVHHRYRLCIAEVGLNSKSNFGDCIQKLNDHNYISDRVANSLNEFRTTLNVPAHELELWSIEDSINYADQMINFIYREL